MKAALLTVKPHSHKPSVKLFGTKVEAMKEANKLRGGTHKRGRRSKEELAKAPTVVVITNVQEAIKRHCENRAELKMHFRKRSHEGEVKKLISKEETEKTVKRLARKYNLAKTQGKTDEPYNKFMVNAISREFSCNKWIARKILSRIA